MKKLFFLIILVMSLACSTTATLQQAAHADFSSAQKKLPVMSESYYLTVGTVYVRNCADLSCRVVGSLPGGIYVKATCAGDWCRLENGYVRSSCLGYGGSSCQKK